MYPATNPKNEVIDTIVESIRAQGSMEVIPFHLVFSYFRSFDVLHVHWPDAVLFPAPAWRTYLKTFLFLGIVLLSHALGRRIAWTVHNMESHEKYYARLESLVWNVFLRRVDHVIHLCRQSEIALANDERLCGASHILIPHPHYVGTYPNPPDRAAARRDLDIPSDRFVFLFFGMIRPHKGVEELIDAFSAAELLDALLIIAGEPIAFPQERLAGAEAHPQIRLIKGFLDRNRLEALIRACDVVVLPYLKILNSGVAITALSLGRTILAPRAGAMVDLAEMLGERWVRCYDGLLTAADLGATQQACAVPTTGGEARGPEEPDLSALSPSSVASRMTEVFLKGARRARRR